MAVAYDGNKHPFYEKKKQRKPIQIPYLYVINNVFTI